MHLHLNRLSGPDADDIGEIVEADGHSLTSSPEEADLVVTGCPDVAGAVAPGASIVQLGGPVRLSCGSHRPTPVLGRSSFRTTAAARALGVDLLATATLLIDTPRTAIVGARSGGVVPLVTNAHDQHLALLFPHDRDGWHWWVHEDTLDPLPWIDAAIEHHLTVQPARQRIGA
ncbi:hypothetical protein ATJ97_3717 [Georgenia soli]|uniref:Uncharacterized protein n=1 Tax=Georgenia soli TaxID=638953 RepID=A0A2A9ESI9_9MICO|nr:hypothetical protein [Georgenia soli]PFG41169.1 hypothetical protein ATJ97_3717 [Georgenia soli]